MSAADPYYKLLENEALVSFLQRLVGCYGVTYQSIADRLGYYPRRRDEDRTPGNFYSVATWLEMDPSVLRRASESWLTTGINGISWRDICPGWAFGRNYDVYCPECLSESSHWRYDWLVPHAFICKQHGILLLRECSFCLTESSTQCRYLGMRYYCLYCGKPFSDGARVRADQQMLDAGNQIEARFDRLHTAATDSAYAREVLIAWWVIVRKLRVEDVLARSRRWVDAALKVSEVEIPSFSTADDRRPYLFAWRFAILSRVACMLAPFCVEYLQGRTPGALNQQFRYFLDHWSTDVIKGKWEAPAAF